MPPSPLRSLAMLAALLVPGLAAAQTQPLLADIFADHGVLQRGRPIAVWGNAAPGAEVEVRLAGASAHAKADKDGNWHAELPAMDAGGPYDLTATSGGATQAAHDLLVGDVWLCSGQSNMEFTVAQSQGAAFEIANAHDAEMRLLVIAHDSGPEAKARFKTPIAWKPVAPESVRDFSAACYFMARDLRATEKVPFGLIDASWGGTAINPWRTAASFADDPAETASWQLLSLYRTDPAAAAKRWGETITGWWRTRSGDTAGREPWSVDPAGEWRTVPKIDFWESWGVPELAQYNGIVWYSTEVTLTAAQAKQPARLTLGVADDLDWSFVNGIGVGTTNSWDDLRDYPLARGTLHKGVNRITVGVLDTYGPGGLHGTPDQRAIRFADGTSLPLPDASGWRYRVTPKIGDAPHAPWETIAGLGGIYNGMIAPLGHYGLRGVAWYQGETDANIPTGYAHRLAGLMSGWRTQFDDPELPFLIVQLPNWGARNTAPEESGFASIRDEQRRAVAADAQAELAVTIDLGDVLNLHPFDKQDVGHRLARAAGALVYGSGKTPGGPRAVGAMLRADPKIRVAFEDVDGGLVAYSGSFVLGFEWCPAEGCRFVSDATIDGDSVVLGLPQAKSGDRIRFCWGDSPVCNLSDKSGIPASPFELVIR